MKNLFYACLATFLFFGCGQDQLTEEPSDQIGDKLASKAEIDQHIRSVMDRDGIYNWKYAPNSILYSAAMQSDSMFAIGYQLSADDDLENTIHEIDIQSDKWQTKLDELLNLILEGEQVYHADYTVDNLLPVGAPKVLPSLTVRITNPATIEKLRNRDDIRYFEAMGYVLEPDNAVERSSSGCGASPNYSINSSDYTTISPYTKRPWNFATSNIPAAWNNSTGDNVTVTIIDTGTSDNQDNLGSQFTSGYSGGRTVEKYSTKYSGWWWWRSLDSPHDQCGHGTQMAGLATAPRGTDGNSVGIAYDANLIGIRAVEDVFISSSDEKEGVKDALILAANRSDVKVISMSLGTPFSSGTVADGVYYAYNRGKMIMAAAGTSFSWSSGWGVIFPATMSQTVAVTGVKDAANMQKCNTCHSGDKVDFVMTMQRASNNDRTTLTLALTANQPTYVGGSSAATASVAGIAALIYSSHPGATRSQVYNAMKQNASFYPSKNSQFGWGFIDANDAVNMPF